MNEQEPEYGDSALALVAEVLAEGVEHAVLLMRHSAREFEPGRHDLENPLTDEGRDLARRMGSGIDKRLRLRGYASPAERCVETTALILEGHRDGGGEATRYRAVEALGVFYVLDQMKMFKAMTAADGQLEFLERWYRGELAGDVMIPADVAARLAARVAAEKLNQPLGGPQLDVCVSHDMTLYLVRDRLLGERSAELGEVRFLDALIMYNDGDKTILRSHRGNSAAIDLDV
jgi:broad specificity phosphatase PhoE